MAAANVALANDTVTRPIRLNERANDGSNGRLRRGHGPAAAGARGGSRLGRGHGGHGKHCRSRRSWPPKAERSGAGSRPDVTVITARTRRRGHGPLWRCCCRSRRVTARAARHGGHGRSWRARREHLQWGLSPPGARERADLPGDRATAGGRGPHIHKSWRAGKENRFDSITFGPELSLPMCRARNNASYLFGES